MNISQVNEKCCGCRNCLNICPIGAINFENDIYGFEYPVINKEKCIDCGLCSKKCPSINPPLNNNKVIACGVAYALDEETRRQGSSGGIFGLFAKEIIKQGGVVFGAAFDENLKLITTSAQTNGELRPLYKSKYLLCDTNSSFEEIKKILESGHIVLYTSSPCQIAALKLYLKKNYENLLTIEFICHGVGSQTLFDNSIAYYENKKKIKIKKFEFRYKKRTTSRCFYIEYEKNGKIKEKAEYYFFFPYYYGYYKNYVERENCRQCIYASKNRVADMTIGDFHEITKHHPEINREKGCSMLLVNTEKGYEWLNKVKSQMFFQSLDKEILYKNNRFSCDEIKEKNTNEFFNFVLDNGFEAAFKKHLRPHKEWKKYLYYSMPVWLKNLLKKVL